VQTERSGVRIPTLSSHTPGDIFNEFGRRRGRVGEVREHKLAREDWVAQRSEDAKNRDVTFQLRVSSAIFYFPLLQVPRFGPLADSRARKNQNEKTRSPEILEGERGTMPCLSCRDGSRTARLSSHTPGDIFNEFGRRRGRVGEARFPGLDPLLTLAHAKTRTKRRARPKSSERCATQSSRASLCK
jgi:hypothetical protein